MPGKLWSRILRAVVAVDDREVGALLWSFAYFFFLLSSYYILRPVREAMGLTGGVRDLAWLFTGTFIAMLVAVPAFGAVVARLPRRRFVPLVYRFFALHLVIFAVLIHLGVAEIAVARVFYIWTSVYNLFVVSVFWSVMADVFRSGQGKRLFGFIAAGGTLGTLLGSWFTVTMAERLGLVLLLITAIILLEGAVRCSLRLLDRQFRDRPRGQARRENRPDVDVGESGSPDAAAREARVEPEIIGGGVLSGISKVARSPYLLAICLYILCLTTTATFLYFVQADIVSRSFADRETRTAFFALINLLVSLLTVLLQIVVTARLLKWLGVGATLAILPAVVAAGFVSVAAVPALAVIVGFQVVRRSANYAIARPTRELLFTVVGREEKYKCKNVIDTVVYRGGDAVSGWAFSGLQALGLGLAGIAIVGVPIAVAWFVFGLSLGRRQEALSRR